MLQDHPGGASRACGVIFVTSGQLDQVSARKACEEARTVPALLDRAMQTCTRICATHWALRRRRLS